MEVNREIYLSGQQKGINILVNEYMDNAALYRRLELDIYYLGHRSFWLDCKTLFLTFASIVFGKKF